jgi:hypothetical protein
VCRGVENDVGAAPVGHRINLRAQAGHIDTASSQAITGADRVFFIRVEDNRLVMKSPGLVVPMTGSTYIRPVEIELVHAD